MVSVSIRVRYMTLQSFVKSPPGRHSIWLLSKQTGGNVLSPEISGYFLFLRNKKY